MKRRLLALLCAVAVVGSLSASVESSAAPAKRRDFCDPADAMATNPILLHHNGKDFAPVLTVQYQTGGGWLPPSCLISGDYVFGRFKYGNVLNEAVGGGTSYQVARYITVNTLKLRPNGGGTAFANCDNTNDQGSVADGNGCDHEVGWIESFPNGNASSFTQTDKYNCDRNGDPGEHFEVFVDFTVKWYDGATTRTTDTAHWNSQAAECAGYP